MIFVIGFLLFLFGIWFGKQGDYLDAFGDAISFIGQAMMVVSLLMFLWKVLP